MFSRLLIANRGEIAGRVIRTAQRLGIHTIAVYSDADAGARHVRLADQAVRLGPAAARDSYLSMERVLAAAQSTGAEAIHPGYGFLSERADFATACGRAGIAFVGPPAAAMAAMGSKSAAKAAMQRAGVPVLPGYHGAEQSLERLEAEAEAIGYPLMVKPSAGGGGKGMQIVASAAALRAALLSAQRIAASAFGDATLLIERYVPAPRHIEVQLLCDGHGRSLHLGTRDCSVQRRHQKLIEEAPAPAIPAEVRERLHAAGLGVARAVGYVNAGTVEFLYADGEFWFMEMNTRLQVEHCVTEQVYGLDLVEWQLRIAAGEPLPFAQEALRARGHAIEARVCAEDPAAAFAPSAGLLELARWPVPRAALRSDIGFETGDRVPTEYDSLLGKIVGSGPDRNAAIASLERGLAQLRISGIATNAAWLAEALRVPALRVSAPTTRFVEEYGAALAAPVAITLEDLAVAALALTLAGDTARGEPERPRSPWQSRDAFRINLPAEQQLTLASRGVEHRVGLTRLARGWRVRSKGAELELDAAPRAGGLELRRAEGTEHVDLHLAPGRLSLWRGARRIDFAVIDPRQTEVRESAHDGGLIARLPGTVVAVPVKAGDEVEAGATLMVLEAMKMEHAVLAPHAGRVLKVLYAAGERVAEGAVLVELAAPPATDSGS